MKLWTWHKPDFSLTSGRVEHSLSSYYSGMPAIPPAYSRLANYVGTDQIIWCYARSDEFKKSSGNTRIEWVLDVSEEEILGIIDEWVWERIIGSKACPPDLERKWEREAEQGDGDYLANINARKKEYLSQSPPDGGWWTKLFTKDSMLKDATVLLRHPIPESWVVRKGEHST